MIKKILIFLVIILTLIQGIFYYKNKDKNNIENKNINIEKCIYKEDNAKNIKEINKDLKVFGNNEIISYNKNEDKWIININLKGSKDEIKEALLILKKNYNINNYNLDYKNRIYTLKLEIQGK
ncbi:hypothetical protein [Clostridium sp.]|uniref:hypothetical protein n=1 Tax=Clostridium sp. TaxID=1506 RepID=UPI00261F5D32|nr:hypothetical protein [Clostridium sp.]